MIRVTASQIRSEGGQSWSYECDVSDREAVKAMAQKVRKEVGDVNILVNNAGIMITKQFLQQTDTEVQSTINVSKRWVQILKRITKKIKLKNAQNKKILYFDMFGGKNICFAATICYKNSNIQNQ